MINLQRKLMLQLMNVSSLKFLKRLQKPPLLLFPWGICSIVYMV